ncbi:MAG: hypothetical protein QNJ73_04515 [Gammaproteobacteria bacterium]|nr:hypothetical protein [Gammaproteobacteria bacterium]
MSIERAVKGKRPVFVAGDPDENINRLLAMVSALGAEIAVLRDRQRTLEQLLAQRGSITLADIEEFQPDYEDLAERSHWQAEFLRRIHQVFEREADAEAGAAADGTD